MTLFLAISLTLLEKSASHKRTAADAGSPRVMDASLQRGSTTPETVLHTGVPARVRCPVLNDVVLSHLPARGRQMLARTICEPLLVDQRERVRTAGRNQAQ